MRGGRFYFTPVDPVTTDSDRLAAAQTKEARELRQARIQNGKEPGHDNGPWPGQKEGEVKE